MRPCSRSISRRCGAEAFWSCFPGRWSKRSRSTTRSSRRRASTVAAAWSATFSIAPQGKALEAQLEVVCRNSSEAGVLAAQFQKMTEVLREILKHEKQTPGPGDLTGVLTAGVFQQQDTRVLCRWPIER